MRSWKRGGGEEQEEQRRKSQRLQQRTKILYIIMLLDCMWLEDKTWSHKICRYVSLKSTKHFSLNTRRPRKTMGRQIIFLQLNPCLTSLFWMTEPSNVFIYFTSHAKREAVHSTVWAPLIKRTSPLGSTSSLWTDDLILSVGVWSCIRSEMEIVCGRFFILFWHGSCVIWCQEVGVRRLFSPFLNILVSPWSDLSSVLYM